MRVGSVFAKRVVTAGPDSHIHRVAELMEEEGVGAVVITEHRRPVAIVTDRDLALALGRGRANRSDPVRNVMTSPVDTIGHGEGIFSATQHMREHGLRRLPIVDDAGELAGMVTLDDLVVLLGQELGNLGVGVGREMVAAR
jgi:CBS domain-containing protein